MMVNQDLQLEVSKPSFLWSLCRNLLRQIIREL
jgi:hypothetical protein